MSASPSRPNFRRQFKSGIACVSYETTLQIFPPFSWLSLGCTIHGRCWRRDCTQLVHNLPLRQTTQREPKPIHNPNNGRRQEARGGRKVRRRRLRSREFHQFRSPKERGETEEEEEEWRARTGSEFGEAAKKMGKVAMAVSQSTSSVFKGDFGERDSRPLASAAAAYFQFLFLRRQPDVKTEFVTVRASTLSKKVSWRGAVASSSKRRVNERVCQPK